MALTKATLIDLNANELILDLDADTSITADTDDTIDFRIGGSDEIKMTSTALTPATADGSALGTAALEWADLFLADASVISLGADQDVTLTHVHNTGLLLNSTMALQFNDASQYINAPSATVLDINATDEVELNATLVDINANVEISGTATTTGVHTFTAVPVLPANSIDSAHYVDGSIDAAHMSANSIDSASYVDGSIDLVHLSANSVDSDQYVDGSIDTAHIANDQITAALIADNAIDSDMYVDGSIDNAHLADDAVDSDEIAAGAIDLAHMSVNSIDSDQYVDGSIDTAHIANDQITAALMADNSIDSDMYVDGSIDTAHIANDQITAALMADNSIDSDMYVDGSIDNAHLADDAVDSDEIAAGAIDAAHMSANSIDSASYVDGSIDTAHIANDQITAALIADNAIDSDMYVDGSIDTAHIADNQITLAKLAGGTDGNLITYDASGDPAAVATGTAGHHLESTGAGSPPVFAGVNTPAFTVYKGSGEQAIANATWTKVELTHEYWDTDSAFDSSTNYRFTVPAGKAGGYLFTYGARGESLDAGENIQMRMLMNEGAVYQSYVNGYAAADNQEVWVRGSVMLNLTAGDYLSLYVYQNEGAQRNIHNIYVHWGGFRIGKGA